MEQGLAQKALLEEEIHSKNQDLIALNRRQDKAIKAREVINHVAKATQEELEEQLANLVTMCLATIFDDPYQFKIRFEHRRNTIETDLLFIKDGEECKPIDSSGGGALDTASFGLRVGLWTLNPNRPVFILDEPFKNLSIDKHEKASVICKELCDELKIQIIMVSHSENILEYADKVFRVEDGRVLEE